MSGYEWVTSWGVSYLLLQGRDPQTPLLKTPPTHTCLKDWNNPGKSQFPDERYRYSQNLSRSLPAYLDVLINGFVSYLILPEQAVVNSKEQL